MGAPSLLGSTSPFLSTAPHPPVISALVAARANPVIAPYYAKLGAAGKTGKQVLAACMPKLLVILNAMLQNRKPWQPA